MLQMTCFLFFGEPEDTSCWSQRQSNNDNTSRLIDIGAMRCLYTTGLCEREFVGARNRNREGERYTEKGCTYACLRSCRNSSRATINPDTKEHSCTANMLSLASALAQLHCFQHKHSSKIKATGSPSEKKLEFCYFHTEQHIQDIPVRALCSRLIQHVICLLAGQLFI